MTHYFDETPLEPFPITVRVRGEEYEFISSKGMFSKEGLDTGTRVLLENMQVSDGSGVLDLGCGIGVVGILVKKWFPQSNVVLSDVTNKSMELSMQNAKKLKVEVKCIKSDVYEKLPQTFDVILTNPPRAAGKDVIRKMIEEAPDHLNMNGSLQLVALSNKGGKSYEAMMEEAFGNAEVIGRGSGFKVYKSVKQ
jgi:16S rRNA (guanine1207-N2)-methyltransferase